MVPHQDRAQQENADRKSQRLPGSMFNVLLPFPSYNDDSESKSEQLPALFPQNSCIVIVESSPTPYWNSLGPYIWISRFRPWIGWAEV